MPAAEHGSSVGRHDKVAKGFRAWGINAKVLVFTEPFWSIPMGWIFFYRPLFLKESIGLSEVQIGLLSTILTFSSVISPLVGGYLADRFGRKRVLMVFDSIACLTSSIIWVITRNIWFALVAFVMESLVSVIMTVWECMLVEDTVPEHRASIFGYISVVYNFGALSTPIAGILIGLYGLDMGCRILFGLAFALFVPMFAIRQRFLRETEIGYQIMKEKSLEGMNGYRTSLSMIKKSRVIAALLLVSVIGSFYFAVAGYMPLYYVDQRGLGLTEEVASLIPATSSISALIIASLVIPRLNTRNGYVKALVLGYVLGFIALILLSYAPRGNISLALVAGAILGSYLATSFPVSRTLLTNEIEAIDSTARAKVLSLMMTLSYLLNLPAPTLIGYIFSLEPKMPLIILSVALIIAIATMLVAVKQEK